MKNKLTSHTLAVCTAYCHVMISYKYFIIIAVIVISTALSFTIIIIYMIIYRQTLFIYLNNDWQLERHQRHAYSFIIQRGAHKQPNQPESPI